MASAHQGRVALDVHARSLSFLVRHRCAPLLVVEYRDRRRHARIYRSCHRASGRLSVRHRHSRAALYCLRHWRVGIQPARAGIGGGRHRLDCALGRICALSRAALPAHAHGVSRRAVRTTRRGVALCTLCGLVVVRRDCHARARLSLGAGKPAALQDEPYLLRRSRRLVRRQRRNAVPVRPADLACGDRADLVRLFLARHADRLEHARRCDGARRPGDARLH